MPDTFVYTPEEAPVTLTTTAQELLTAKLPPVRLRDVEPATAEAVPPHEFERPLGVATTRPAGSVSEKATPASATVLAAGFVMVKVRVEVPLRETVVGAKASIIDGGATMLTLAEAAPLVPPSVEVTVEVVLFFCPAELPVTLMEKVQELDCEMVPPERLRLVVAWVAVMVPLPQEPESPLGVETTRPLGSGSEKATPDREEAVLLF